MQQQWYALHVKTGSELLIAENILKISALRNLSDSIIATFSGIKKVVGMKKAGRRLSAEILMPGYIFVQVANYSPQVWHFLKEISGVFRIFDQLPIDEQKINELYDQCKGEVEVEIASTDVDQLVGGQVELAEIPAIEEKIAEPEIFESLVEELIEEKNQVSQFYSSTQALKDLMKRKIKTMYTAYENMRDVYKAGLSNIEKQQEVNKQLNQKQKKLTKVRDFEQAQAMHLIKLVQKSSGKFYLRIPIDIYKKIIINVDQIQEIEKNYKKLSPIIVYFILDLIHLDQRGAKFVQTF